MKRVGGGKRTYLSFTNKKQYWWAIEKVTGEICGGKQTDLSNPSSLLVQTVAGRI
jgi:hypothetical protein